MAATQSNAPAIKSDGQLQTTTIVSIASLLPDVSKISEVKVGSLDPKAPAPKLTGYSVSPMATTSFDAHAGRTEYSIQQSGDHFSVEHKFTRYPNQGDQPGIVDFVQGWEVSRDGHILGSSSIKTEYDSNHKRIVTEQNTGENSGAAACTAVIRDMLRNFSKKELLFNLNVDGNPTGVSVPVEAINQPITLPEDGFTNYVMTVSKKP